MKTSEELRRDILQYYNQDPRNWRVFLSRDEHGFHNTIVTHNDEIWFMKEELVNPYKSVGLGVEEKIPQHIPKDTGFPFGFRSVNERQMKDILESEFDVNVTTKTILSILSQSPRALQDVESPVALQGPLNYTTNMSSLLPKTWTSVDTRIRSELTRLIERKYPHLRTMYG